MKVVKNVLLAFVTLLITGAVYANGLMVDSTGKVGVGTNNPANRFDVQDTEQAVQGYNGPGGATLTVHSTGSHASETGGSIGLGGQYHMNGNQYNWAAIKAVKTDSVAGNARGGLAFYTRPNSSGLTERVRVDDVGRVGIGTATPQYTLDVNGTARVTTLIQSSDERLKKDIKTVWKPLDRISKIRGVSYKWNDMAKQKRAKIKARGKKAEMLSGEATKMAEGFEQVDDRAHMGLIAQEVEQVFPEAVYTDGEGMKGVAYSQLIGPMIEAIKELSEQNKRIESQNKRLKKQNELLAQRVTKLEAE